MLHLKYVGTFVCFLQVSLIPDSVRSTNPVWKQQIIIFPYGTANLHQWYLAALNSYSSYTPIL